MIPEIRIILKKTLIPENRPVAVFVPGKQGNQPFRQPVGNFLQCKQISGMGWIFNFEIIPIIIMKPDQGFDQQVIHRHPYRSAPVRIASKKRGV